MPVPSTTQALSALARLTLTRLLRGKLMWVSLAIACLPLALAGALRQQQSNVLEDLLKVQMVILSILPPLFAAPTIGEELEDRTATYLWSRPLARWAILAGKLLALAPFVMAVMVASWVAAVFVATKAAPPYMTVVGIAGGAVATAIVSAGIATLAPKRGMAFAIIYILIIDLPLGNIPTGLQWLSVTHATRVLTGLVSDQSPASGALALIVLSGLWLAVAFRRIGSIET